MCPIIYGYGFGFPDSWLRLRLQFFDFRNLRLRLRLRLRFSETSIQDIRFPGLLKHTRVLLLHRSFDWPWPTRAVQWLIKHWTWWVFVVSAYRISIWQQLWVNFHLLIVNTSFPKRFNALSYLLSALIRRHLIDISNEEKWECLWWRKNASLPRATSYSEMNGANQTEKSSVPTHLPLIISGGGLSKAQKLNPRCFHQRIYGCVLCLLPWVPL